MASSKATGLLNFFTEQPSSGPTLADVLSWDDYQLEVRHDYIQWLFPLPETSGVSANAPTVTAAVFAAFHASDERARALQQNARRGFVRMMAFYGWTATYHEDALGHYPVLFQPAENQAERCRCWVRRTDHNHLRLTRILRSLRVLGLEKEAATLWREMQFVLRRPTGEAVSQRSRLFWARAAERPLHEAPDDSHLRPAGSFQFLKVFEEGHST